MITLPLHKPGDQVPMIRLNLSKETSFKVVLRWWSGEDVDAHALLIHNDGSRGILSAVEHVLSTHNSKKTNKHGVLETNQDGSFSTPCGTLRHSGDTIPRKENSTEATEIITIDSSKAPQGINEIPIFITIHNGKKLGRTFAQVTKASITIVDDADVALGAFELTNEFGKFHGVQMGSLLLGENGWEYAAVGNGIVGDFNTILANYSS